MTDNANNPAPVYSGWQAAPMATGWSVADTGTLAASLALAGTALMPADMAAALAGIAPGQWAWDAHFETLRGDLPALGQEEVARHIGAVVQAVHAAAARHGRPANPLVADLMAARILINPASPLRAAAWEHFFPGIAAEGRAVEDVLAGLAALMDGRGEAAATHWAPWLGPLGIRPFDRMLQAAYKADPEYALGGAAAEALRNLWSRQPDETGRIAALLEMLLYFGRNDSVENLLSTLPAEALPGLRQNLATVKAAAAPARCRVSVVLISWNRAALLDQALHALRGALALPDSEILVGLNGCTDDSEAVLARHGIVPAIRSPENRGIDLYRDVFALAGGDIILEIDDDVLALPPRLDALLLEHFAAFPEYGALSVLPWVRQADGGFLPGQSVVLGRESQGERQVCHGSMWGCCLAIRRSDFYAGNGFYGATLSKRLGEEDQLMRKLYLRQRKFGFIEGARVDILP